VSLTLSLSLSNQTYPAVVGVKPLPVTVTVVPGGPYAGDTSTVCARAGVAGMASISREKITANARIRKILLYFTPHLHYFCQIAKAI
jgi:hypothetical protein